MTNSQPQHYTPASIKEIADKLGIQDEKVISELAVLLEEAATQYLWGAKFNTRISKKKSDKEFKRLAKKMADIKDSFHTLTTHSMSGLGDFEQGLYKLDKSNEAREILLNLNRAEYFYTPERVANLLESLESAFKIAAVSKNAVSFEKRTKTQLLLTWIWSIDEFWTEHSKVPISEGRYSEMDDRHVSKAIEIFDLMANPISAPWPITDSMIFQAIKLGRNSGNMVRCIDFSDAALEEMFQ